MIKERSGRIAYLPQSLLRVQQAKNVNLRDEIEVEICLLKTKVGRYLIRSWCDA